MKKSKWEYIPCIFIAFLILFCSFIYADFEITGSGARTFGLNYAFTALADDTNALFYNPAGLGQIRKKMLGTGYRRLFLNLDDDSNLYDSTVGFVYPLESKVGTIGVGWYNFGLCNYYSENVWLLSVGCDLLQFKKLQEYIENPLFTGISFKILTKKYIEDEYTAVDYLFINEGNSKSAFGIDFGLLYSLGNDFFLGMALIDLNQPNVDLEDTETKVPIKYKLGLAYKTTYFNCDIDIVKKNGDMKSHLGAERWFLGKRFTMRGGIGIGSRKYRDASLGMGYKNKLLQIDYAFNYPLSGFTETNGTHSMSLNIPMQFIRFDFMKKKEEEPKTIKMPRYFVQPGDTLPGISAKPEIYNDAKQWRRIYEANRDRISPTLILEPGMEIIIPRD
ncbi:MAG: type IX secretion system membrane protein PorP/SprF [Elusimicrobia bacterium]|nr:type IX secretion system membrane protein PorP/SprF [Elusimicrobiota bacterium]